MKERRESLTSAASMMGFDVIDAQEMLCSL
jgi:hypothetical protein